MIVTLTLNPALDKSTEVPQLIPEKKLRCTAMVAEAGGGGINVSKALRELDAATLAIFPCGGINGALLTELLREKDIEQHTIKIGGNTRESVVVTETSTNRQYKFVMPGPDLSQEELDQTLAAIKELKDVSFLVCSGSLPPNVPAAFLGTVAAIAKEKGMKFVVDTSGEPLQQALKQGVYMIKPNMSELCSLVNKKYLEIPEIDGAVDELLSRGVCETIVVSMGPSGAMLATRDMKKTIPAPMVKKLSTVGAGDSMIAGIVWMLEQHHTIEEAVQFGVACGTAATISKGTQLFHKEDAFRFYEWIRKGRS